MNSKRAAEIREDIRWQEITPGGAVYEGGTASAVKTGDWRVMRPVFHADRCRQCLLCAPTCPDMAVPVKDGKREDFDYFYCKGCGICFKVCPFQAISFEKETHQEVNGDGNP